MPNYIKSLIFSIFMAIVPGGRLLAQNSGEVASGSFALMEITILVVFIILGILFIAFKGYTYWMSQRKKKMPVNQQETIKHHKGEISGEVNAAIALSIFMYWNDAHDFENTVLTVKKVTRPYSPWSSKIHTLRRIPRYYN